MKLGILKTDSVRPDWVSEFGEYPDMFIRLLGEVDPGMEFVVYDVQIGEYPQTLNEVDAYLITGSKASAYDDEAWIATLIKFVQTLHEAKKKLLGICFGHQIVAQALGGKVERSPRGWGVGLHTHRFKTMPGWHDGEDADYHILVSHQDQVTEPANGAESLAGSDFCPHAVTQLGDHILTFQGHPEFVEGYSKILMISREDRIDTQTFEAAMATFERGNRHQSDRVARWMLNFLQSSSR